MEKDDVRKVGIILTVLGIFGLVYFTGFGNVIADQVHDQTSTLSAYSPMTTYPLSVKSPEQKVSGELEEQVSRVGKNEDIPVVVELSAPTSMAVAQQTSVLPTLQAQGLKLQAKNTEASNTLVGTVKAKNVESIAQNPNVNQILYDGFYFQTQAQTQTQSSSVNLNSDSGTNPNHNLDSNLNPDIHLNSNLGPNSNSNSNSNSGPQNQIALLSAWDQGYKGQGVKVILIDSGIQNNHPALMRDGSSMVLKEESFIGRDVDYTTVHGTHCAGIIASQNEQYKGVAPEIKGFVDYIAFTDKGARLSWILSALDEAYKEAKVSREPVVVSNSWGAPAANSPELNQVRDAVMKLTDEAVVVFAAGNRGPGSGTICAPGDADSWGDEVITVGAVDSKNNIAVFSSRGADTYGMEHKEPDVVAPGVDIMSTVPGGFEKMSGTSMATPYVSGVAALLLSKNSDYSNKEVLDILEQSSKDLGVTGFNYDYGYGIVQAGRALEVSPSPPAYSFAVNDTVLTGLSAVALVVGAVFAVNPSLKRYLEEL